MSLERVRWLSRDMFTYSDFYETCSARWRVASRTTRAGRCAQSCRGPLKLRSLEPFEHDIQLFKNALQAHAPDKEAFYCVVAPEWLEEFVWNEVLQDTDDEFVVALRN